MKRHESLIPLTHDHHHALAQARRLRLAAVETEDVRRSQATEFLGFYAAETLTHFREEEETVFPLIIGETEAQEHLTRVMLDHLRIHSLVGVLRRESQGGHASSGAMTDIADALENHIRFEEKTLFPMIERLASDSELRTLSLVS
jgi:iron-sulfur cluster repair protein YtfE (RIC family)